MYSFICLFPVACEEVENFALLVKLQIFSVISIFCRMLPNKMLENFVLFFSGAFGDLVDLICL